MVAMLLKKRALDENGNDIGNMLQYLSFNENNELVVDDKVTNFDRDAQNEFSLMLRRILMSIHGNYDSKRAAIAAEATWYGEIGLPLRRWIEPSAERRYNQEHYSELTKDVRKGFARSSLKYLFMNNKLFAPLISFIARNIFRVKDYQIQVMKWSDLSDLEKQNLRRMIMELAISTIAVLGFLLVASGGDDDDEPAIISNLRYQLYRLYTDLTFFYLPTSFSKILQSPFPAINYLNDIIGVFTQIPTFWQEYETGRHTFDNILLDRISDVIPGVKQIGRFENIGAEMEYFIRRN